MIAPDFLGYGGTDKPTDIASYTTKNICADFAALLDLENISKVIVVGHDWGAATAWRFALWYPERVRMIAWYEIKLSCAFQVIFSSEAMGLVSRLHITHLRHRIYPRLLW